MDLVRINGRYRLQSKAGSGTFGEIYLARDILSGQDVAIKLELMEEEYPQLEHEFDVYRKLCGGTGILRVHWFGCEASFNAMVIDRLGHSLDDLFVRCDHQFSVKTVLFLACQLISRLQFIHSRNFIHCDLKPSNLVMGVGKHANLVYIIDFGLSKQFRDPDTHMHNPYQEMLSFIGTAMFASIHSHLGVELGRRDDLESLAYILIYFLRGSLPWQGLGYPNHNLIVESKQKTSASDLCQGLPAEFRTFLEYSRSLAFDGKPDYGYLSRLFNELLSREGYQSQQAFDWDIANNQLSGELDNRRHKRNRCLERRTGLRSQTASHRL